LFALLNLSFADDVIAFLRRQNILTISGGQ